MPLISITLASSQCYWELADKQAPPPPQLSWTTFPPKADNHWQDQITCETQWDLGTSTAAARKLPEMIKALPSTSRQAGRPRKQRIPFTRWLIWFSCLHSRGYQHNSLNPECFQAENCSNVRSLKGTQYGNKQRTARNALVEKGSQQTTVMQTACRNVSYLQYLYLSA